MLDVPTITDDAGHQWTPRVDHAVVRYVQRAAGLDLEAAASAITSDRRVWGAALYLSVEPQATEYGIGPEAFARLMCGRGGDWLAAQRLTFALLVALANHLPGSRLGLTLRDHTEVIAETLDALEE